MHKFRYSILFAAFILCAASSPAMARGSSDAPRKYKTIIHRVKPGDTYEGLAKRYHVRVEQLKRWNRGVNPRRLQINQKLKIAIINPEWREWRRAERRRKRNRATQAEQQKKVAAKKAPDETPKPNKAPASSDTQGKKEGAEAGGNDKSAPPKKLAEITPPSAAELAKAQSKALTVSPGFTQPKAEAKPSPSGASKAARAAKEEGALTVGGEELPVVRSPDELSEDIKRAVYVLGPRENVGSVALKFRLDPEDILHWNELTTLTPPEGAPLVLKLDAKPRKPKKALPVIHRVRRGDNYGKIAKRYGVSISQLKRWNRRVNPRRLQIGQTIRMYIPGRDGRSVSYGSANRGRLYNGVALETTDGLEVRSVSHAYGTQRVVWMLKAAVADVQARWPTAPDLVVGDISYRRGGRIKRHKSHQSGRDADISFYYRGNVQLPNFEEMDEVTFDAAKNWHLFKTLIDTGEVEYIFVEYDLQKMLYDYAKSIGYTEEDLAELIQYPRPRYQGVGLIRYARGHDDHWHIRFKCGPHDKHCR